MSGGTPYANFSDLAHAWGRDRGFHHVLVSTVFSRRGEVDRKRRSDAGVTAGTKRSRSDGSEEDEEDDRQHDYMPANRHTGREDV